MPEITLDQPPSNPTTDNPQDELIQQVTVFFNDYFNTWSDRDHKPDGMGPLDDSPEVIDMVRQTIVDIMKLSPDEIQNLMDDKQLDTMINPNTYKLSDKYKQINYQYNCAKLAEIITGKNFSEQFNYDPLLDGVSQSDTLSKWEQYMINRLFRHQNVKGITDKQIHDVYINARKLARSTIENFFLINKKTK